MAKIVLVAGAWHGKWCWDLVAPLLKEAGFEVHAPDLVGMGADATPLDEVNLSRWADQIAELVQAQGEPVVLLGHSRAGIVISEVAERVPQAIRQLVYLSAFLLPNGESLGGALSKGREGSKPNFLVPSENGLCVGVAPEAVATVFYNTTSPDLVERARAAMGKEPLTSFATPLNLSSGRYGTVKRAYIECLQDRAIPIAVQRVMQSHLPCDPVESLDTDHCPFFSAPTELVRAIERVTRAS